MIKITITNEKGELLDSFKVHRETGPYDVADVLIDKWDIDGCEKCLEFFPAEDMEEICKRDGKFIGFYCPNCCREEGIT